MSQIIGVSELQQRFKIIFDRVVREKETLILTRDNLPEAVLIPYEDFALFQRLQETEVLARFDGLLRKMAEVNATYSDDEIVADLELADNELED